MRMPDHCFTYGSLMCDDIMGAVCAARAPACRPGSPASAARR
jgi:hypothetical protein